MRLIKPSFEIIEQQPGLEGMLRHIERIGRVCYKSEDKIGDTSYQRFVNMLKDRKHGAMFEHGTVYLKFPEDCSEKYEKNRYSVVKKWEGISYITTNYRVIVEEGWEIDLSYMCEPTPIHEKRYSVKFTTDRGVTHELVRNRGNNGNGFAMESTRYCNYSKEKFGGHLNYIIPNWEMKWPTNWIFNITLKVIEWAYFLLTKRFGWSAQQTRSLLPHIIKADLVITATETDWKHFFSLRADKHAHPQVQQLMYPLKAEMEGRGWL